MSQAGSLISSGGTTPTNILIVVKEPTVDMTVLGSTLLFTPAMNFIMTGVYANGINLSGVISAPSVNIGFTAPNYDDFASATPSSVLANGQSLLISNGNQIQVPASTGIYIKVIVADATATSNTQRIDITGYYL